LKSPEVSKRIFFHLWELMVYILGMQDGFRVVNGGEIVVCHLADVHLGYRRYNRSTKQGINQREEDVNLAFNEAVSRIISIGPDITLIAGDLFHQVRPSNSIITFCFRQIRRLAQGTKKPVVILSGNHESPKRVDTGCALRILSEIEGVYVAEHEPQQFAFPEINLSVTCLPHASLLEGLPRGLRADDKFVHNILMVHGQIGKQWISDFGGVDVDLKSLSPHEWDYIALGHVHIQKDIAYNASYSGATEHTASNIWSEAETSKGFLQISLPSKKKIFHSLSSPRDVAVIEPLDSKNLDAAQVLEGIEQRLSTVAGGIEGKILRLDILNLQREVFRNLNHKKLREWRSRCLNLTIDIKAPQSEAALPQLAFSKAGRLRDELSQYCDSAARGGGGARDKVKNLLLSYLDKIEGEDEARQS